MNTLPKNLNKAHIIKSVGTQSGFSGDASLIFSKETLLSLSELGDVLASIQKRMTMEGYDLVNGVVTKIVTQDMKCI